jgi:HEAT repeat protein
LGKIGDTRATEPLLALLRERATLRGRGTVLYALGQLRDPRSTDVLIEAMSGKGDNKRDDRIAAARGLGEIGGNRAAEALAKVWQNENDHTEVRLAAAGSLGRTHDHRAVDALAFLLEKGSRLHTLSAIESLWRSRDPRAKNILRSALKHKDTLVRKAAQVAIERSELLKEENEALEEFMEGV